MSVSVPPENFGSTEKPIIVIDGPEGDRQIGFLVGPDVQRIASLGDSRLEVLSDVEVFVTESETRFAIDAACSIPERDLEKMIQQHAAG